MDVISAISGDSINVQIKETAAIMLLGGEEGAREVCYDGAATLVAISYHAGPLQGNHGLPKASSAPPTVSGRSSWGGGQ